ncbi:chondroitin sulfate synthase 1-like [Patiria miniata]|uniref:N-acetylgalactosaminyl-proteoglycan 3-beta-glucuronosyltransferase n=1 Tax=Patiria miniata TaxID=46514 RepID=A0A914BP79_PATMI|nr:chondroitin sulfate synthase 1-like [Patiria miniata]
MTVRRTLRRIGKREVCIVLLSLTLGFLLATWLRAHPDSDKTYTLLDKRCNAAVNPRAASQEATVPPTPPKNFIYIGVMTAQKYLSTRAVAINRTWARTIPGRVDFYSSATSVVDPKLNLPIVRLQGVDDSYPPQKKSFLMIKYMHDNFIDKYEWFMRADDDVYVRGDRLEPFLRSINSSQRLFIGQAGLGKQEELGLLNLETGDNFCMGGPGMIFSRETLRKLVPHVSYCLKNMWSIHEDVEVGRCIKKFAEIDCTWAYEVFACLSMREIKIQTGSVYGIGGHVYKTVISCVNKASLVRRLS